MMQTNNNPNNEIKMKRTDVEMLVDSLKVEELSSREELVEMVSAQEVDKNQDVTILAWNIPI